jgi:hypothetical protein
MKKDLTIDEIKVAYLFNGEACSDEKALSILKTIDKKYFLNKINSTSDIHSQSIILSELIADFLKKENL